MADSDAEYSRNSGHYYVWPRGTVKKLDSGDVLEGWQSLKNVSSEQSREAFISLFKHARFTYSKREIADILGITVHELNTALAPRINGTSKDILKTGFAQPPQRSSIIASFRDRGWTTQEIGDALGVTRQTVIKYSTPPVQLESVTTYTDIPQPERIYSIPRRLIPRYVFIGETTPMGVSDADRQQLQEYVDTYQRYRASATFLQEALAAIKVICLALRIVDDTQISLPSLSSIVTGGKNRPFLSRLLRKYGVPAYLPPSLAVSSSMHPEARENTINYLHTHKYTDLATEFETLSLREEVK